MRRVLGLLGVLALSVTGVAPARAADPGRWRLTGVSKIPLEYYQGVTSDPARRLWFDGVFSGLYRADAWLHEQTRNVAEIPPDVTVREGYNHIGDIAWDRREGGRVLLPLECYYPGQPNGGNTCRTGSIGVADPDTLRWRYYVKLAPAELPKAMWAEVSPDGRFVWTSSGPDLLAYRTADIEPGNAAPIHAVRRLPAAVPPTGITGAAFYGDRLLLAGQADTRFQVWSVDLASGARRLEIERTIVGESEGLAVVAALGGTLHWIVTPLDPAGRPPTYPPPGNALLHFAPTTARARAQLSVSPLRVPSGVRVRVTAKVTVHRAPAAGADVRLRRQVKRTGPRGIARFTVRLPPGRYRIRATRADLRPRAVTLRAVAPPVVCAANC
jgi:hypothetical protein